MVVENGTKVNPRRRGSFIIKLDAVDGGCINGHTEKVVENGFQSFGQLAIWRQKWRRRIGKIRQVLYMLT